MIEIEFLNSGVALADLSIWYLFLSFLFFGIFLIWGLRIFLMLWRAMINLIKIKNKRY